jgi:hypothetical protein
MFLAQTSGSFGESIQITGSGNQFFSISEVRVGGVSGVAAEFQVPNKNTISFVVPSFSSLTESGQRNNWVNNCQPSPVLVIAESRNASGFASGYVGEEKNFSPIPQINGFTPVSGVSGDTVVVKGDGFFGLTGLSIINISGSPNGYSDLTGLSNVVTGVGFPYDSGSGYADQVYLDFTITNNTGLSFTLPSGNFDGNIKVYGSGNVSAISDLRIEPHVAITGFDPPIGNSGSYLLISGGNFFDELIDITSGLFSGVTGDSFAATGVLVAFNGENATGCFTKLSNILLSGLIPLTAKSGPIKIAKNINVLMDSGEVPYYQSTGIYFLNTPAPEISGLTSVGGEESFFGFDSILETGSYNSGVNSGISLTGSSVNDWKTGTAIFAPPIISAGLYDQSISGSENQQVQGPLFGSSVEFIEESFIPMADGNSLKNSLLTLKGENFFESGVTGGLLSGSASAPINIFAPVMGPEIDECLDHFNAGSGFLSGCEQAYLLHFSGHHKFLDLDSPDFQPGLLQCFMTDQQSERAVQGNTGDGTKTAIKIVETGESGILVPLMGGGISGEPVGTIDIYNTGQLSPGTTMRFFYTSNTIFVNNTLTGVSRSDLSIKYRDVNCNEITVTGVKVSGYNSTHSYVPIDLGPDSSPYQINQYPTVGNLCSPRHIDSADAQLIISGISSGVAVTEITGYNTIPLAAPITGTESIEALGDLILDATPPNLDPYATSLGEAGTSSPPAGPGPSVKSTFPPKTTSALAPVSIQVNTYGQGAFKTHLGGTIPYPPEQGPVYTRKAKTDPFTVIGYSNPNKPIYSDCQPEKPIYIIPKTVTENPTTTNWTVVTLFKNGRQPSNLAGTLTPSQLTNYANNPGQVPGFNRIFFTNKLNSKGNPRINMRPQGRGLGIIAGTSGPVNKTLNTKVNPRLGTGSQRKGVLKVSPPPSSVYGGLPGLYKPNVPPTNEVLSANPPHAFAGGIPNNPGIPGLIKFGKGASLGGGSSAGGQNTPWKRTRVGGGGKAGSNQTNPPIIITCIEPGLPGLVTGINIPTNQTQNPNIGVVGVGHGQKPTTTLSPVKPNGPIVNIGPLTPPPSVTRIVTQNFPTSPPPHLYPPPSAPISTIPLPPLELYPRVSPTQTEGMTNICASPCTPASTGNTGWGIGVLADPEIEECAVNDCFQHCVKTGSSGYSYYEPVAQSKFVIKNSVNVPYHTSNIVRTGMLYCSGDFPDTTGVFIENSGVGVFEGGYLTTEASTELDLSAEDKWTVQFWTKFENHHGNIQNEPYSGIDVNLFGFSGKHAAESGNTFFNVGFTREITNQVTGAMTGDTNFEDVRLLLRVTGDGFDASLRNLTGTSVGVTNTSTVKFSTVPSYTFDGDDYILIDGRQDGYPGQQQDVESSGIFWQYFFQARLYSHIWDFNRQALGEWQHAGQSAIQQNTFQRDLNGSAHVGVESGAPLTIEFFLKMPPIATTSAGHDVAILSAKNFAVIADSGYGLGAFVKNGDSNFTSIGNGVGLFTSPAGDSANRIDDDNWHHIAFCKSGNNMKLFVNGIKSGESTSPNWNGLLSNLSPTDELYIGKDVPQFIAQGSYAPTGLSGTIQELRISNICRYSENFTVPTAPYPVGSGKASQYITTNTVKPYADLSGIQSSTNYHTGWFADNDWHHFAFVRNETGYATYYDGYQVGKNVPAADYDCFIPSGHTKFYFGGLPTGRFGKFNTGFNQQFISGSDTDLLLHFNSNLADSGRYNQTITSGGFPTFTTGVDDKYFGSAAIYFDGSDYLQTSGEHFAYGTGDFTIECWIKPSGATLGSSETGNAIQTVWTLANQYGEFSTGNGLALMLNHHTNNLRLAFDSEIEALQVDLVPPLFGNYFKSGEWNHVAITRENNIFYGFVNGDPAGGFGGEDFAEHEATKLFFTGNPSFTDTSKKLFIGGAVSGDLNMFFADTGELFDSQPYKLTRDAEDEHYSIVNADGSCDFRRYIGKESTLDYGGAGYTYVARSSGIIEITLETLSRWGGAGMTAMGIDHSFAGVRFEHNGNPLEADGTPSDVGLGENTIRWQIGGWQSTLKNSNTRFVYGELASCDWAADGANDYIGPFIPNCDEPKSISMRGCQVKKTINQIITGVEVGDEITLIANRYFNEGGPADGAVTASNGKTISNTIDDLYARNTMGAGEDPLASGPDILHIQSMLVRENLLTNYVGLMDEFRISSGVKYSNTPDTGSFATGYLNTDLGGKVYVDELNIRKDSLIPNMGDGNGIEEVPSSAPATGYNFEVVIDSGNLITNGTTGDNESQTLKTFLTDVSTTGGAMVTFSENGYSKFGNHSMRFPTGATTTGAQNFLYKSGINFGTGDFLAEMWIKPSGFTYATTIPAPDGTLTISTTNDFRPIYIDGIVESNRLGTVQLFDSEGNLTFTSRKTFPRASSAHFSSNNQNVPGTFGVAGLNGAFRFENSGLATGDASYMLISGNKTSGDMFPALNYPFSNPVISTKTGSWGDFSSGHFSIEFHFRSDDRRLNQKIFEWGDLGFVINDGGVGNNYFFIDGSGGANKRTSFFQVLSDGDYHTVLIARTAMFPPTTTSTEIAQSKHFKNGLFNTNRPFTNQVGIYVDGFQKAGTVMGYTTGDSIVDCGDSPLKIAPPYSGSILIPSDASGISASFDLAKFRVWKGLNLSSVRFDDDALKGDIDGKLDPYYLDRFGSASLNNVQVLGGTKVDPNTTSHFLGEQWDLQPDGSAFPNRNRSLRANPMNNAYLCILDIQAEASVDGHGAFHVASSQTTQFKDSSSNNLELKNYNVNRHSAALLSQNPVVPSAVGENIMWFAGMFRKDATDPYYQPALRIKEGNFDFGTAGDFTIECWFTAVGNNDFNIFGGTAVSLGGDATVGWNFMIDWRHGGQPSIRWYDTTNGYKGERIPQELHYNFQHIACVRHSGTLTIYLNGTAVHSHANTFDVNDDFAGTCIGPYNTNSDEANQAGSAPAAYINAHGHYMDQLRVSNVARYTSNFTRPTGKFSNDSNTKLLIDTDTELTKAESQRVFDRSFVPSSSGITNAATVTIENSDAFAQVAGGAQTKQTLLALGDYDRGFNFFLTGDGSNNINNLLGLDLYNGGPITGATDGDNVKCQLFNKQGAAQYWTSGDWNHIALARINNNFQAYINGYSAGKLNVFNTYYPSGQTNDEGDNIGLIQILTGQDENGNDLFVTGGAIDDECVNQLHFGNAAINYYVTGTYSGIGIDTETGRVVGEEATDISGHYVSGLDVSGRLVLGGGSQDAYNFQGEIDAFSFNTGTINEFTGLKMHNPEPFIECDEKNELVCHFDRVSGSIDFDDEHCCITGDDNGEWGQIVGIKGSGFFNITGVLFGTNRQPSLDFFVPERNYISAEIPDGASSGPTVILGSGLGADSSFEITGCNLEITAPPITIYNGNFPISGQINEVITISGRGLNQVTNIAMFNALNQAIEIPFSGTNVGSGISFAIPDQFQVSGEGQIFDSQSLPIITDIRFSGITGFYGNSPEIRSFTTGDLFILKSGIEAISPATGVHNEEISLSGRFYSGESQGVDIPIFPLFQTGLAIGEDGYSQIHYTHGINTKYIKSTVGSTNGIITGITTQVPRDIVRGALGISGSGITVPNTISDQIFTPAPTISGIEITNLKVGSAFRMTGVNACYIRPVIGFTGINLQPAYAFSGTSSQGALTIIANTGNMDAYESGTYFLDGDPANLIESNTFGDNLSGYNDLYYFSNIFVDKSQLTTNWPESAQTGFVIITGTLNGTTIGTGNPFLISNDELINATGEFSRSNTDSDGTYGGLSNADDYEAAILRNEEDFVYATQNISKVTGDQIIISGRVPQLSGLKEVLGTTGNLIQISGTNLLNITGVFFSGGGQYCEIGTGAFEQTVVFETGLDPLTRALTTTAISTGYYLSNSYQGTGEYLDRGDWINSFFVIPDECANLNNIGTVTVDVLYNTSISTTGNIE